MVQINVLLGSSSVFRRKLLSRAIDAANEEAEGKVKFVVVQEDTLVPDIDEKAIRRPEPAELTRAITTGKTNKLLEMLEEDQYKGLKQKVDLLISGDQVIGFQGTIREKATDKAECKEHLQSYGLTGSPAEAFSCIEVTNLKTLKRDMRVGVAKAFFKPIPDDVVEKVIQKELILVCAGSLVIEEELLQPFIEKIEGEIECIQGFPKTMVKDMLLDAIDDK